MPNSEKSTRSWRLKDAQSRFVQHALIYLLPSLNTKKQDVGTVTIDTSLCGAPLRPLSISLGCLGYSAVDQFLLF